jgi:hypothetical protein
MANDTTSSTTNNASDTTRIGVVDIDDKPASTLRFAKGEGELHSSIELRYMEGRNLVQKVIVADRDELIDAVGEKNAKTIENTPNNKGVLRGDNLNYAFGQSPAEVARGSELKLQRDADEFARESVNHANELRARERQEASQNYIIDRTHHSHSIDIGRAENAQSGSSDVPPRAQTIPQPEAAQADVDRTREALRKRYIEVGDRYHFRDKANEVAFKHSEREISTKHDTVTVARDMVELAASKGWQAIELKGTETFKREAWMQASLQGIAAEGYQPREVDVARFEELKAERERTTNRLNSNNAEKDRRAERQQASEFPNNVVPIDKASAPTRSDLPQRALPTEEREAVTALQAMMRERGDSEKAVAMASKIATERFQIPRTYVGTVVEHGAAPYQHEKGAKPSYYITIDTREGRAIVWGKELSSAVAENNTTRGQLIALENLGKVPVTVVDKLKDQSGNVVDTREIDTNRNQWRITPMENIRDEARQYFEQNDLRRTHKPRVNLREAVTVPQPTQTKNEDMSQGLER